MRRRVAILIVSAISAVGCGRPDPGVTMADPDITTALEAKLAQDDTVKAYQIDVDTSNGVVTLSGAVENGAAKAHAVMLARQTGGVRDVMDQITIDPQAAARTGREAAARDTEDGATATTGNAEDEIRTVAPDAVLTAAVKGKLLADTTVAGLKIDVDTDAGVVTLNGSAKTRAEADRAVLLARTTDGVKNVVDNIRVGG
jgi:hyperosmotically inducible protein